MASSHRKSRPTGTRTAGIRPAVFATAARYGTGSAVRDPMKTFPRADDRGMTSAGTA
ncbi:hypothetical protein [Streptomyces graminilatus]|uniref:hypothetical protein n=1 Tax=Streptomyces graminilatus TaxID=1464070 RepID=UPI000AA51B6F|nr:hypothetical protein [Streptomyces graminilatus]